MKKTLLLAISLTISAMASESFNITIHNKRELPKALKTIAKKGGGTLKVQNGFYQFKNITKTIKWKVCDKRRCSNITTITPQKAKNIKFALSFEKETNRYIFEEYKKHKFFKTKYFGGGQIILMANRTGKKIYYDEDRNTYYIDKHKILRWEAGGTPASTHSYPKKLPITFKVKVLP